MQTTLIKWLFDTLRVNNYMNKKQFENANTWLIQEAKEAEKEILKNAWETSEKNMRATFSNSTHKGVTFEQYYNQLKK
jgi:hypothetical protein